MRIKIYIGILFLLAIGTAIRADDKITVAIPEFQNKTGKTIRANREELANVMFNEVKKTGEYQPVERKLVGKTIKDAEWSEDRLRPSDEAKLKALPAKYVLYGYVRDWTLSASKMMSSTRGQTTQPGSGVPSASVVFAFTLINLETGAGVKDFLADGIALGTAKDLESEGPPYLDTDPRFDNLFEEASKNALRRAAHMLASELPE